MKSIFRKFVCIGVSLLLLAGCTPAASSSPSASGAAQAPPVTESAAPAPTQSPTVTETPVPSPSSDDLTADSEPVEDFALRFATFFQQPAEDSTHLPTAYYLPYYLLLQTYLSQPEGTYAEKDYFLQIPEADLRKTAQDVLGLENLDLSQLTEWPFGEPSDGCYPFSLETELPYLDAKPAGVTYTDGGTCVQVDFTMNDNRYEDSSHEVRTMHYCFRVIDGGNSYQFICSY